MQMKERGGESTRKQIKSWRIFYDFYICVQSALIRKNRSFYLSITEKAKVTPELISTFKSLAFYCHDPVLLVRKKMVVLLTCLCLYTPDTPCEGGGLDKDYE